MDDQDKKQYVAFWNCPKCGKSNCELSVSESDNSVECAECVTEFSIDWDKSLPGGRWLNIKTEGV